MTNNYASGDRPNRCGGPEALAESVGEPVPGRYPLLRSQYRRAGGKSSAVRLNDSDEFLELHPTDVPSGFVPALYSASWRNLRCGETTPMGYACPRSWVARLLEPIRQLLRTWRQETRSCAPVRISYGPRIHRAEDFRRYAAAASDSRRARTSRASRTLVSN